MDRRTKRYDDYCNGDYDVVDDQEAAPGVRILPAKPMNHEGEYADRDVARPRQLPAVPAGRSAHSDRSTHHPRREITLPAAAPPIWRHLKPDRRTTKHKRDRDPAARAEEERFPPPAFTREIVAHFEGLDLHASRWRDSQQRSFDQKEFTSHTTDSSFHTAQRRSFDLDCPDSENRFTQNLEKMLSRRLSHEWPQTRDDRHDFVPADRPEETFCEEDWYVGACDRADAEHALHLVNKDGAFLVRDCSLNTDSDPLVLVVYYDKKVYNVKIRFIESANKFALGTGQRTTDMFRSVADIIKFHSIFPVILVSGRNPTGSRFPEHCVLTCPVTRRDVEELLR